MLALVDNQPKVLNLYEILNYYLKHQEDVVTRRTKFDLNKAEERAHILQGLLVALDNIDEVIRIIRSSRTTAIAKEGLIERFSLSDAQAQAIVDMRLKTLTGLEREKIENELKELEVKIAELKAILADVNVLLRVIKDELIIISDKYGDDRRTSIGYDDDEITDEVRSQDGFETEDDAHAFIDGFKNDYPFMDRYYSDIDIYLGLYEKEIKATGFTERKNCWN